VKTVECLFAEMYDALAKLYWKLGVDGYQASGGFTRGHSVMC